ncbi:regulator [Streptomyces sp. NPDC059631]|uniref:regulator n=1 Tax=unclassified Streptomyces TaxID=2593676 RepID=UPI00368600FE
MTTAVTHDDLRTALTLLSSPALIRLITEIDDNGPVARRRLAGTLPDISRHQLRHVVEAARTRGLVRTVPGTGIDLTESGAQLADLYDEIARWARHHAVPARVGDFTTRIRHALHLLQHPLIAVHGGAPRAAAVELPGAGRETGLARLRGQLFEWLTANPQVRPEFEPAA